MKTKGTYAFVLILLSVYTSFGFTFTATPTNESCSGNGSITFSASNTDPNGTLVYVVYKLPDTVTPYATISGTSLSGLSTGTYRIIARETVGSVTTTQQIDVVVNEAIVPLTYSVQSVNQACSDTSTISITTITGTAVNYEIFTGPLLFPVQTSNTFTGLPVGVYKVRVFDACGIGVVQTFTVNQNTVGITITDPVLTNTTPPSCNFIIATNTLTPFEGTVIGYPLNITYAVHPPNGGATITFNSVINNGNPTLQNASITIPNYINEVYDYDMTIVDACGSVFTQNFVINNVASLSSNIIVMDCNTNYFELITTNFTPPYSINFTTFPAGFDPSTFNISYPGPFFQGTVAFGSPSLTTPLGQYTAQITDSCGRTATHTFNIVFIVPTPQGDGTNNGCLTNSGTIVVTIPSFSIASATVTVAPATYPNPLPHDVTAFIDANGILTLTPVPLGDYTITLTDDCNSIFSPLNVNVPIYADLGLTRRIRPGCELQKTSIEIGSANGKLISVVMTAAPSTFPQTLPFNVTNQITTSGFLYLDDLPGGTYTFDAVDECNFPNTITIVAPGYEITTSSFSLQPNCGSFDIPLNFVSNATQSQSFWLQKLINSATNTWGHPITNVAYVEGNVPGNANAIPLQNGATNFNLSFNGTFRIVREFISFNNGIAVNAGAPANKQCIEFLSPTLSFNQTLEILEPGRLPCSPNGDLAVVITAVGTPPLTYSITEKDGLPFVVNNGTSNIFSNLGPGLYEFLVEDFCGNQAPTIIDVSTLQSLVNITQPNDMVQCQDIITGNETFDISVQTPIIMGTQSPADYTLTYYTSLVDAQSATNSITNLTNFNPTSNPQTLYARLVFNALSTCYEVRSFDLIVGQIPQFNLQPNYVNCTASPVILDAGVLNLPNTTYVWSTGETTPQITISQLGTTEVTVTATNTYGVNMDMTCTSSFTTSVTISAPPVIEYIETVDWTVNENSITVFSTSPAVQYSLDGINYQTSPTFTGLSPGLYTVFVQDLNGCGITPQEVWLLYYVKYFTPNGDGYNERWTIENASFEPELKVIVYDRYGKAMASFDSNSEGWDGTYNNQPMFATDYWFVVYRQDGRIHKGHFSLKR